MDYPKFGYCWQKHVFIYGDKDYDITKWNGNYDTTKFWDVVGIIYNNDNTISTITTVYWKTKEDSYYDGIVETKTLDEDWKNFPAYKDYLHKCNTPVNSYKQTKQYRVARMRYTHQQQLVYEIVQLNNAEHSGSDDGRSEDSYKEAYEQIKHRSVNIEKVINAENVLKWENETEHSDYTSSEEMEEEENDNKLSDYSKELEEEEED